jgi:predicted AlkP superfamily pyrophosphatase or phosphodiesterase
VEQAYATLSQRLPRGRVYRRGQYPPPYHYDNGPRTGDLLVVMEAPWQVAQRRRPNEGEGGPMTGGQHGYDPALRDMHASFFAWGPGIRPGSRPAPFENIHVYPLVMHVLGLRPNPEVDGRLEVLRPVLRP